MKAIKCNGLSTTSYTRNLRKMDCQKKDHFVHILGGLEGPSLAVCFWPQFEIRHLARWVFCQALKRLSSLKPPDTSSKAVAQPPCISTDHSMPEEKAPHLPLLILFLSWPQTAFAACPAQSNPRLWRASGSFLFGVYEFNKLGFHQEEWRIG